MHSDFLGWFADQDFGMNRFTIACIVFCAFLFCGFCQLSAGAAEKKNVLILNSYHEGYKWTDEETRGVIETMQAKRADLKFYITHMGTKWAFDKEYLSLLHKEYKLKFKNIHFDVIVATDNDAFDFLRRYRDEAFGSVPVVFCGINWFKQEDLRGHTQYTGVNEDADIAANFDLMLKLHPRVNNIYVVVDRTTTGRIIRQNIVQLMPKYRARVNIHLLDNLEIPEILSTVSRLTDDSLVFLALYQQAGSGTFLEYPELAELLSKTSTVPMYGLWDFYLGHGIIGGKLTSGHAQGSSAGALALRILGGESADAIPVIMESPNIYLFDYNQLKRFGLLNMGLLHQSRIINKPPPPFDDHRKLVWSLLMGVVVLGAIAGFFIVLLKRQVRHATTEVLQREEQLRESEERYRTLFFEAVEGILIMTTSGRLIAVNDSLARMHGYSTQEMLQMNIQELDTPETARLAPERISRMLQGEKLTFEVEHYHKDGHTFSLEVSASLITTNGVSCIQSFHRECHRA